MINDKKSTGVTLIEMLVSIVIVAIIVASVYTAFDCGKNAWQVGDQILQKYQNARGALDIMSRDISQAFINHAGTIYCLGIDGETSWTDRIKTNAKIDSDQFFFVAPVAATTSATDLYRVGYWLKDGGILERVYEGPNELFDSLDNDGDGTTDEFDEAYQFYSGTTSSSLISKVTDLDFEYYYGSGWTTDGDWDSTKDNYGSDSKNDGLPKGVKITITVEDDKGATSRIFTTVVYPLNSD